MSAFSKAKRSKTAPKFSIAATYDSPPCPPLYSAEKIANNDDILTEILLRLPVKSLLRFKSVSKHWLSLISNPDFCRRHYPSAISGLFLKCRKSKIGWDPEYDFVNLNECPNSSCKPFRSLTFVNEYRAGIRILQSCNGLLLCCTADVRDLRRSYYVYNPATRQYCTTLPRPQVRRGVAAVGTICRMTLAFDPLKSPYYKVVCVRYCDETHTQLEIEIYSSETRCWRRSGIGSFSADFNFFFDSGVFWNGAVHWVNTSYDSLYFKVDEEQLCRMPMPIEPIDQSDYHEVSEWKIRYFGESKDHLHLIYLKNKLGDAHYNVYEMERDYSDWFIKYRVDLSDVSAAFPEMILPKYRALQRPNLKENTFAVLCVVRGDRDEDSYLVLNIIPGKVLRYNFLNGTFYQLCDIEPADRAFSNSFLVESWREMIERPRETYQYIESLVSV